MALNILIDNNEEKEREMRKFIQGIQIKKKKKKKKTSLQAYQELTK